jgi:hypothetical protein
VKALFTGDEEAIAPAPNAGRQDVEVQALAVFQLLDSGVGLAFLTCSSVSGIKRVSLHDPSQLTLTLTVVEGR